MKDDIAYHSKQVALVVSAYFVNAISLDVIIKVLTIVLIVAQIAHLAWKFSRERKRKLSESLDSEKAGL